MNKLTAEKCREMFLHLFEDKRQDGVTLKEDLYMQALEIALPILEQQERGEGWIEWNGGECPVGDCELVVAKLRDGTVLTALSAGNLAWWHNEPGFCNGRDIIAYRLIENDGREG
ncbi:hypothetical protein [Mixta calida]|uniref:hypothetical protein n=1 Tax=Mixta calida TaxID=665913 RepID=UPI003CFBA9A8